MAFPNDMTLAKNAKRNKSSSLLGDRNGKNFPLKKLITKKMKGAHLCKMLHSSQICFQARQRTQPLLRNEAERESILNKRQF